MTLSQQSIRTQKEKDAYTLPSHPPLFQDISLDTSRALPDRAPQFEDYHPNEPRLVERVSFLREIDLPSELVHVSHYQRVFLDSKGEVIASNTPRSVIRLKNQDSLRVLATYREGGEIFVGLTQSIEPIRAARKANWFNPNHASGLVWQIPGTFMTLERANGISEACNWVLRNKLGVESLESCHQLGGSVFPDPKYSSESCFFYEVSIRKPESLDRVSFGAGFEEVRRVQFVPLQEMIYGYFRGEYQDARILLAAFRLARRHGMQLKLPIDLAPSVSIRRNECGASLLSCDEARSLLSSGLDHRREVTRIELQERDGPRRKVLRDYRFLASNRKADGTFSRPYVVEGIDNFGFDSVSFTAYRVIDEELYLKIKFAERDCLLARDFSEHPLFALHPPHLLEGITASQVSPESYQEVLDIAAAAVFEKDGVVPDMRATRLIGYDFSNGSFNPVGNYRLVGPVEREGGGRPSGLKTHYSEGWYMKVEDILSLADEGKITDLQLILGAHIVECGFGKRKNGSLLSSAPARDSPFQELEELMTSGMNLNKHLLANPKTAAVHKRLWAFPEYRKFCTYCENELGLVLHKFEHPEEAIFFNALIPIYAVLDSVSPERLPFHLLHDLLHYTLGELIPLKRDSGGKVVTDSKGRPLLVDYYEYETARLEDEVEALLFSEYVLPKRFGQKEADRILGGSSVASAFDILGIKDEVEAKEVIRSIIVDGIIPASLITHPEYRNARSELVHHLLRLHVTFCNNRRTLYEAWQRNPDFAAIALRFSSRVSCSAKEYQGSFSERIKAVTDSPEGINPLRARIGYAKNWDVRLTALRLAYFISFVNEPETEPLQQKVKEAKEHIEALDTVQRELVRLRASVRDTSVSSENLALYQKMKELINGPVKRARAFADRLGEDSEILSPERIEAVKGRLVPFFDPLPFDVDEGMLAKILELEERSVALAWRGGEGRVAQRSTEKAQRSTEGVVTKRSVLFHALVREP